MRVLYLSPAAGLGGAERALVDMIRALRTVEPSWPVGLLALDDGPLLAEARAVGADASVLPLPPTFARTGESGRQAAATWLRLSRSAGPLLALSRTLRTQIRAWGPDLVHSNGVKTHVLGAWCAGAGVPLVWHIHDYLSARPVSRHLLRLHRRRANAVVANSHSVAADVEAAIGGNPPVTIYNAVDFSRFTATGTPLDLDALAGLPAPARPVVRVGLIGTFARWKGHAVFLDAVSRLATPSPVRAYVIGEAVYHTGSASQVTRAELEALVHARGLGDRVGFTGFVADAAAACRALDIVVHASTSPEPFGLAIVEAMACGRAVIVSDGGGAREIGVPGQTCLTHAPGSAVELADRIARLVDDAALRTRLGAAAASHVRHRFTHQHMGTALGDLYRQLHRGDARG